LRPYVAFLGALFLVASGFTISAGLRQQPRAPVPPVQVASMVQTATQQPRATPKPKVQRAQQKHPAYVAMPQAQISVAPARPRATPAPAAAPARKATPRPVTLRPRASAPHRAPTPANISEPCLRALQYAARAWRQLADRAALEAYNASVEGLASNRDCRDAPLHLSNEAFLYAVRPPSEYELGFGDWRGDLAHSDDLLRLCLIRPGLRGTPAENRCRTQLRNNDLARSRMTRGGSYYPGG
jgi:hypothetical protein